MQENKTVLFTREHKTLYAQGDKVIKVFDSNYKKSDVLNEARNEALVQENSDLNVPSLSSVSESEEGWCLIRDKVEGVTLAELMKQHPEKIEEYMELFVDLQLQVHKQCVPSIKTLRHKLMDQINSLKEIDATARYELASRLQGMPRHTKQRDCCTGWQTVGHRLGARCTGQRFGRCCHDLPAICTGKQRAGGAVHPTVLQKGGHRQTVCQPLAADCCRSTTDQKESTGKRNLDALDRRHRISVILTLPGFIAFPGHKR